MADQLEGRVALITGAGSGLGRAMARRMASDGAAVMCSDVNEEAALDTAAQIGESGGRSAAMRLDVTDSDAVRDSMQSTIVELGGIDIVVNNAGMSGVGRARVEETTVENWDTVFAVNSTAIMLGTKTAIPAMRKNGGGSVVNVSSIFGIVGSPAGAAYHASKGAARTFSKAAAVQYATDNIRVNSVHPGFTDTPMTLDIHSQKKIRDAREKMTPLGRLGLPDDIAYGILYLACDESSWVTGIELVIDGGEIAW